MYSSIVNLTPFTKLESLTLRESSRSLDASLACMQATLTTLPSSRLKQLHHPYSSNQRRSIDSVLAALARLKDTDALLAQPQFSCLQYVQLDYDLYIYMEDIPSTFNALRLMSADGSATDAGSRSGFLDDATLDNAKDVPERYVERLARNEILEGLKQFRIRGELEINLHVRFLAERLGRGRGRGRE